MNKRFGLVVTACCVAALSVFSACGSDKGSGFDVEDAGSDEGGIFGNGEGGFGSGEGGGGSCAIGCSSDLTKVVDCNNKVVKSCPADQGCAAGGCIPACQAAAANKSSIGCDYYVLPPPFFSGSTACLAVFVANTWSGDVKIDVEYKGKKLDPSQFTYLPQGSGSATTYMPLTNATVPKGQVGLVLLNNEAGSCPGGMKSAVGAVSFGGTGMGDAFHVSTSAPVVAYDLFPYGGGSTAVTSATLLIPTTAWDVNYVTTTAYPETIGGAEPWLGFVAMEDTDITVRAPVAIVGGTGVAAASANTPTTYHVTKGQYLKLGQDTDLSGTVVTSTKPIGAWGGNKCADIPMGIVACDGMHQQLPPVKALGSRYVGVRYRTRVGTTEEVVPWRIVGAVDGTTLTFDPPVAGAAATVKSGQVVEFQSAGPFTVSSQDAAHPFYLAAYMTGCAANAGGQNGPAGCAGDPEFVNVIPDAQYLASYTFFTDPTYPETNLVFTRGKDKNGKYHDVTLDCIGTLTGWTDINPSFQFTRADLSKGNFQKQGTCDNGLHVASSDGTFGLTVWGWGSKASAPFMSEAVSYAYPAGASIQPVNTVIVPSGVK
jgi:hypothetical protein